MGRPSLLTDDRIAACLRYLRLGLNRNDAAVLAGWSRHTFVGYVMQAEASVAEGRNDRFSRFLNEVHKAEAEFKANAHGVIINAAQQGQWAAAMTLLERRFPTEYSRRQIEVTGKDGGPIEVHHTADELIAQVRALRPEPKAIEANGSVTPHRNGK